MNRYIWQCGGLHQSSDFIDVLQNHEDISYIAILVSNYYIY